MQLGGTPVQLYDQSKDGVVGVVCTLLVTRQAVSHGYPAFLMCQQRHHEWLGDSLGSGAIGQGL